MTKREEILSTASQLISVDREAEYGTPQNNFKVVRDLWMAYLGSIGVPAGNLEVTDVPIMLALLKLARTITGYPKFDTYTDMAGYIALAGEIALEDF